MGFQHEKYMIVCCCKGLRVLRLTEGQFLDHPVGAADRQLHVRDVAQEGVDGVEERRINSALWWGRLTLRGSGSLRCLQVLVYNVVDSGHIHLVCGQLTTTQ